jgi:hypothetical protein
MSLLSYADERDRARGALYGLAIGGAAHGLSAFPPHAVAVIDAQGLGLADLADSLLALRR